tara:strand:+ start:1371 stop:1847 length:477 start_codon:yes stop_codon:yes gene_type:complete
MAITKLTGSWESQEHAPGSRAIRWEDLPPNGELHILDELFHLSGEDGKFVPKANDKMESWELTFKDTEARAYLGKTAYAQLAKCYPGKIEDFNGKPVVLIAGPQINNDKRKCLNIVLPTRTRWEEWKRNSDYGLQHYGKANKKPAPPVTDAEAQKILG